jgi:hypothetical protein
LPVVIFSVLLSIRVDESMGILGPDVDTSLVKSFVNPAPGSVGESSEGDP